MGPASHTVIPVTYGGVTTVVIKDPAQCGQQPGEASFVVEGNTVRVLYSMPADDGKGRCEAIAVATLHNLPPGISRITAEPRPAALAAAKPAPAHEAATMSFLAASALPAQSGEQHAAYPLRDRDTMLVTVKDAAPCGARAVNPSFRIEGGTLRVDYELAGGGSAGGANCLATEVFRFHSLPDRPLQVVATALPAPESMAMAARAPDPFRLGFLATAAVPAKAGAGERLSSVRTADRMTVVLRSPTRCGARATAPSAEVSGGTLHMRYSVPAIPAAAEACVATEVFTVHNLPDRDLTVVAEARHDLE
jgi:hypothetical protein